MGTPVYTSLLIEDPRQKKGMYPVAPTPEEIQPCVAEWKKEAAIAELIVCSLAPIDLIQPEPAASAPKTVGYHGTWLTTPATPKNPRLPDRC
jgi:hypothetical protein